MSDTSLKLRLGEAVKVAMRAKDSARLGTLRLAQAAIQQKEVDERRELSDAEVVAILEKQVKQRRESAAAFEQAGRADTAAQERAEIEVLQEFLPRGADPAEIAAVIEAALAELAAQGASGPSAMGKAMALVKPRLAGRADMAEVSKTLAARLKG
ncbi:MAG: GatB/YqeY domain-containing protein [Pigmentiphaga sp.]|nr:GatB/YqeY domain-containing protein [Pigmentiphaga sp.]